MSHLSEPDPQPGGAVAALYAADEERQGYVANYTRVFAHRPAVYAAWQQLNAAVKAAMDPVRYEVATVAAAQELRSSYCTLAHGQVLAGQIGTDALVGLVVVAEPTSPTERQHTAVAGLARAVARAPSEVRPADLDRVRATGLDDAEVLDVVLAAAARCFFSSVLEATGAEPDPVYRDLPAELRDVLTVGRPIQAAAG